MGSHQLTLNQSRSLAEYLRMQTKLVIITLLVCFIAGCYAPFPRSDWRSIFNPFIEPWWCSVSKGTREFLHETFAGGPLEEDNKPKILLVITGFRSDRIVHNLQSVFTDFAKISHLTQIY